MTHRASSQADGHADQPATLSDVAVGICYLVAAAKLAGVPFEQVLLLLEETWDVDVLADPDGFHQAAERITS